MSDKPDYSPARPWTSQPPPKPVPGGKSVHDRAIADALRYGYNWLGAILRSRRAFGIAKYGDPLQSGNGRNPYLDAIEELADAVAYLSQAVEEGYPDARVYYEATIAVAGSLANRLPHRQPVRVTGEAA